MNKYVSAKNLPNLHLESDEIFTKYSRHYKKGSELGTGRKGYLVIGNKHSRAHRISVFKNGYRGL